MSQAHGKTAELLASAAAARQRGQAGDEVRLLDLALQHAPDDPQANNARAMRALADREFDRAIAGFRRAAAADPGEPALLLNLAHAYRLQGDTAGERGALQGALDLDQLSFTGQLRMAELCERERQAPLAAQHWSAVVQLAQGMADRPPLVNDALARGSAFLAKHQREFAAALDEELGGMLPAGPEARRFRACVDHATGRRKIYRNECAGIHYPFLPADEFFDRAHFPWMPALEARTEAIAAEALALLDKGGDAIRPYVRQDKGTPENKWSALDHSLEWSACFLWEYGAPNEAVCALCPETAAALAALPQNHVPGKAPSAFFSILRPGARIPPHTGVTNTRTIVHLPLVVPEKCGFRVGGETREWKVGEAFAFDDTIEHEAWNGSDRQRIVLIFDVWNPYLSPDEQQWLTRLFQVAGRDAAAEGR